MASPRGDFLAGFGSETRKNFRVGAKDVGHAGIIAAAPAIKGIKGRSGVAIGNAYGRLANLIGDEADTGPASDTLGPEPKIVIGRGNTQERVTIQDIGMHAFGGIEGAERRNWGVLEGWKTVRRIPAPFRIGPGASFSIKGDGMNTTGKDITLMFHPRLVKRTQPMTRIVKIVIGRGNESLRPLAQRRNQLCRRPQILAGKSFSLSGNLSSPNHNTMRLGFKDWRRRE